MGNSEEGAAFLASLWPGARGLADPEKRLYEAFNVARGGVTEMFGPEAFSCGVRATMKGHFIGRKKGDAWTLPTFILIDGVRIVWRHDGRHAGDHPVWTDIAARVGP
jgi:hypothetical protein